MCRPREASPPLPAALALLLLSTFKAASHCAMGSRARQLQPVGAHLQALQPVGGDGAPVADMLVDEFSMAGANLLLPKAADAVASLTMTTIAMPDAMPLAMAQPVAQKVLVVKVVPPQQLALLSSFCCPRCSPRCPLTAHLVPR